MLADALLLQLGYNATLVTIGATLLGMAAGVAGTFLFLRKRALVSDAISHATLPGVGLAFVVMVALGGDGRALPGLLLGAGVSAAFGLLCVQWLTARTRLGEDAAIGAVLSVFFGFGVVILTVIQTMTAGRQAGLEGFLLGSTAGMLRSDAVLLAVAAALVLALVMLLRRPLELAAFDPGYAQAAGWSLARIDLAMMGIVLVVTVVGLKVVGLILIVALLIVPAVTARFWTDRTDHVVLIAGAVGGLSGYAGAALSAVAPALPTGPIIVLVGFALFLVSLLVSPGRGLLASVVMHHRYQRRVHMRQGLLALAQGQPIFEALTRRLLHRAGLILPDGVATAPGQAAAAKALLDETRWSIVRMDQSFAAAATRYDGLTPIEDVLTPDQLREVDARIDAPQAVL
ncbi:metal ABC transporter permease [uncultured Tateyamaria sp.]|uniref:metal ABC transporter permease n=1 Tax=uncultured Tateyamaria sp. TaxID=455651 RepID=UPI0026380645|nr:metal ABC transporter permease [uncultured Tateyamaria sp.]